MNDVTYGLMYCELFDIWCHNRDTMRALQFLEDIDAGRVLIAESGEPVTWAKNINI